MVPKRYFCSVWYSHLRSGKKLARDLQIACWLAGWLRSWRLASALLISGPTLGHTSEIVCLEDRLKSSPQKDALTFSQGRNLSHHIFIVAAACIQARVCVCVCVCASTQRPRDPQPDGQTVINTVMWPPLTLCAMSHCSVTVALGHRTIRLASSCHIPSSSPVRSHTSPFTFSLLPAVINLNN